MGKDKDENKSFVTPRDALSFLLNDETEAVNGYDLVLRTVPLEEVDRIKLERIRNAEIDHIKDLSDIYQKYSTAKFVGADSRVVDKVSYTTKFEFSGGGISGKYNGGGTVEGTVNGKHVKVEGIWSSKYMNGYNMSDEATLALYARNILEYVEGRTNKKPIGMTIRVLDSRSVKDSKWVMHQHADGYFYFKDSAGSVYSENGEEKHFMDREPAGEFYIRNLYNADAWDGGVPRVVVDERAPGIVVKTDGGWIITSDHNGWLMYSPYHHGVFRYGSTFREYATVFKTEAEANKVAQEMLREAYDVKDSVFQDYSARGSFNSIGELKSHYAGATLLPEGDQITVVLKSGAELVYSYVGNGRLAFIRGKN